MDYTVHWVVKKWKQLSDSLSLFFPPTKQKSCSCKKQIVSKGEKGGGINWEIEIDCIAQETLLIPL